MLGAIARMRENLHDVEAYHLVEVAATAGHLHIAVLAMIHLLLMGMSWVHAQNFLHMSL